MKARITVLAITVALLLPSALRAQVSFRRTYGGGGNDGGQAVVQITGGGYYVGGYTNSYGSGGSDGYVVATDENGKELWTQLFGGAGNDDCSGVAAFTDGGVLAAGWLTVTDQADVVLHANTADGDQRWVKVYGGTKDDLAYSVARNSDGGFIVAGVTYSFGAGTPNVYLLRIDSLGDTLWTRSYGGANPDLAHSARPTADSGFIICGTTYSYGAGGADVYLIKTDAHGDTVWTRTYGGARDDVGWSVVQTKDQGYFIVGNTNSYGSALSNLYAIKTDSAGDTTWTRTFGETGGDLGCSGQETSDSGYVIVGSLRTRWSYACLIKIDRNGDTLWTRTFGGTNDDRGYSVQQTADGGYVLAGQTSTFGAGGIDVWLIKTDSSGEVAVMEPKTSPARVSAPSLTCEPNPFRSATVLRLTAEPLDHSTALLRVYDAQGRLVRSFPAPSSPAPHPMSVIWDGTNDLGHALPSGTYFVRATGESQEATARVVLER